MKIAEDFKEKLTPEDPIVLHWIKLLEDFEENLDLLKKLLSEAMTVSLTTRKTYHALFELCLKWETKGISVDSRNGQVKSFFHFTSLVTGTLETKSFSSQKLLVIESFFRLEMLSFRLKNVQIEWLEIVDVLINDKYR